MFKRLRSFFEPKAHEQEMKHQDRSLYKADALANRHPYEPQRVEGFDGPARKVWSLDKRREHVFPVRPMVELVEVSDARTQVPLPIGRRGSYARVETSPLYKDVAWAHSALKSLAEEYDDMHHAGMQIFYERFHAQGHRLVISQQTPETLWDPYEPRARVEAPHTSTAISVTLPSQSILAFSAKRYQVDKEVGNALVHELVHVADGQHGYSRHPLFERALLSDMLNGEPDAVGAILGMLATDYRPYKLRIEMIAIVGQFYTINPARTREMFPAMTAYFEQAILPDLGMSPPTQSYLADTLNHAAYTQNALAKHSDAFLGLDAVLAALVEHPPFAHEAEEQAFKRGLTENLFAIRSELSDVAQEAAEAFKDDLAVTRNTMLTLAGRESFPSQNPKMRHR